MTETDIGAKPGAIPKERRFDLVSKFQLTLRLPEAATRILFDQPECATYPETIERGLKEVELYMATATESVDKNNGAQAGPCYGKPAGNGWYNLLLSQRYTPENEPVPAKFDGRELARELIALIRTQLRLRKELGV
jgi:hypothetical protein